MKKGIKRNIYIHEIDLVPLTIKNKSREEFRKHLESVKYRGYEVEQLADGRKIVITKPGGKFTYGQIKREDFMVWVYNPNNSGLWLISHKDICNDLEVKAQNNPQETVRLIDALEKVFKGEEPEDVLKALKLNALIGEPPELILKAYKWIWGQEDCNYPHGEGREMSMKVIRHLRKRIATETPKQNF